MSVETHAVAVKDLEAGDVYGGPLPAVGQRVKSVERCDAVGRMMIRFESGLCYVARPDDMTLIQRRIIVNEAAKALAELRGSPHPFRWSSEFRRCFAPDARRDEIDEWVVAIMQAGIASERARIRKALDGAE